jgi:hypothetical protein
VGSGSSGLGSTLRSLENGAVAAAKGEGLSKVTITAVNATAKLGEVLLKNGFKQEILEGRLTNNFVKTIDIK